MSNYIRCPECSFAIGIYYDFFTKAKNAIINEELYNSKKETSNFIPEKMIFKSNQTPTMEKLFDSLNIKNPCCRMHIFTPAEFDKKYN